MSDYEPSITIKVDVTNPGQFFACCGLLELADRLWPGAEGWFDSEFRIACPGASNVLFDELAQASLEQVDPDDEMASPLRLSAPFDFALNWWTDELTNGKQLKVWAGSMRCARIANAMKHAILDAHDPRTNARRRLSPSTLTADAGRTHNLSTLGLLQIVSR